MSSAGSRGLLVQLLLSALRGAGEATRLRILSALSTGELTVSELTRILGQSQPRVSRHLKLLCDAGLLMRYQEGSWVFHRLADSGEGARVAQALVALISDSDGELRRDRERLQTIKQENAAVAGEYFKRNASEWDGLRKLVVADADVEQAMLDSVADMEIETLVDFGTGTGRVLEVFAPVVGSGIGFDLSREMLMVARVNLDRADVRNCQVRQGDIRNLPLASASVNVVTIHQVLHYLDHPAVVIAEAARVLTPGGRLLIVDFAPHQMEFLRKEHAHRRLGFADQEVRQWSDRSGLTVQRSNNIAARSGIDEQQLEVVLWVVKKRPDNGYPAESNIERKTEK